MQIHPTARPISLAGAQRGAGQQGKSPPTGNALITAGMAGATPSASPPMTAVQPALGGNALLAAQPGAVPPVQASPMAPPAPTQPAAAQAAPPTSSSPNPDLDAIADAVRNKQFSAVGGSEDPDRFAYMVHAFAPLVRQKEPITTAQLIRLGNQTVKDGQATPEQVRSSLAGLPSDPAGIKQAITQRFNTALLAAIHTAGQQTRAAQPPSMPEGN